MYFFNISSLFRNLKYILKYLIILACLFIFSFLLMMVIEKPSKAESDIVCYPTGQNIVDLPYSIYSSAIAYYIESGYSHYFIIRTDSSGTDNQYWLILFNGQSTDTFFINQPDITTNGLYWFQCSRQNIYTRAFNLTTNSISFVTDSLTFGNGNYRYRIRGIYSGSYNVYFNNGLGSADPDHVFYPVDEVSLFTPPSLVNKDNTNWGNTLVNGEFNYFYIDGNSVDSLYLYFYDTTYGINDEDNPVWGGFFDENSQYALHDNDNNIYWSFSKNVPFGSYQNNHSYKLVLQYLDSSDNWQSIDYTWTTDFSQAVIDGTWDNGLGDINKGIQDTNNFLTSDKINNADFDLPEINVNDFTSGFFTTLVGSITNAFIDTTYNESITFQVRGNTYTINSQDFDILGSIGLGVIKNFTALLWVFGIGYWIFCDARIRISRLREFNWQSMFADDISVNML